MTTLKQPLTTEYNARQTAGSTLEPWVTPSTATPLMQMWREPVTTATALVFQNGGFNEGGPRLCCRWVNMAGMFEVSTGDALGVCGSSAIIVSWLSFRVVWSALHVWTSQPEEEKSALKASHAPRVMGRAISHESARLMKKQVIRWKKTAWRVR